MKLYQTIGLCLNLILAILSFLIPKEKNRLLFGARYGEKFLGNPKYFFLYLLNNKNFFKYFWITSNKALFLRLKEKKIPIVYLYSWKGFNSILRSEFIIFDTSLRDISYTVFLPGNFYKVQTWHGGLGIKKLISIPTYLNRFVIGRFLRYLINQEEKSFNLVLSGSDHWKKIYSHVFQYENIRVIGYPRNDIFFDRSRVYENYEKKFNLKKYDKVILYCPTYREDHLFQKPFSEKFLVKLNKFLKERNFVLLDKRHPDEKITPFNKDFSNIICVTKDVEDIQDLLIHVDILITDYSSTISDFSLTDKPIIFYPYDFEKYCKTRELVIDYFNEFQGPFAMNENDLLVCIENIDKITGNDEYQQKYQTLKNRCHRHKDDQSCRRLLDFLKYEAQINQNF